MEENKLVRFCIEFTNNNARWFIKNMTPLEAQEFLIFYAICFMPKLQEKLLKEEAEKN